MREIFCIKFLFITIIFNFNALGQNSVTEIIKTYNYSKSEIKSDWNLWNISEEYYIKTFDKQGRISKNESGLLRNKVKTKLQTEEFSYNQEGLISVKRRTGGFIMRGGAEIFGDYKEEYDYTQKKKLKTLNFYNYDFKNKKYVLNGTNEYKYNALDSLESLRESFIYFNIVPLTSERTTFYTYLPNGKISSIKSVSGEYINHETYKYIENGNLALKEIINISPSIESRYIERYDFFPNDLNFAKKVTINKYQLPETNYEDSTIRFVKFDNKFRIIEDFSDFKKDTLKEYFIIKTDYNSLGKVEKRTEFYIPSPEYRKNYGVDSSYSLYSVTFDRLGRVTQKFGQNKSYGLDNNFSENKEEYDYIIELEKKDKDIFDNFVIFPNPAIDKITITNTVKYNCFTEVYLSDTFGRKVIQALILDGPFCTYQIDLNTISGLKSGYYILTGLSPYGAIFGKPIYIHR